MLFGIELFSIIHTGRVSYNKSMNEKLLYKPSVDFLEDPMPKLPFVVGRFQFRQWLIVLSCSSSQLHMEFPSDRTESSKLKRSHSSFHSWGTTSCGCGCCACCGCTEDPPPAVSPTFASSSTYPCYRASQNHYKNEYRN